MSLTLIFFCALRNSNPRPIAWRMASLPTHLSSTCDSVKNNFLFNYHMEGPLFGLVTPTGTKGSFSLGWCHQPRQKSHPLVRVGVTNRDKRVGPFIPGGTTNRDKRGSLWFFCLGWCLHPRQKTSVPPAGPASRWTRDKSHLLSWAQRQSGKMAWNKGLFCSSEPFQSLTKIIERTHKNLWHQIGILWKYS